MTNESIKRSPRSKGKKELETYMGGGKLSYRKAIIAKCFECMNGYIDGMEDCGIKTCPLYPSMPYRPASAKIPRKQPRQLSGCVKKRSEMKAAIVSGQTTQSAQPTPTQVAGDCKNSMLAEKDANGQI